MTPYQRHKIELALDHFKVRHHYATSVRGKASQYAVFADGKQTTEPTTHSEAQKIARRMTVELIERIVA